MKDMEFKIDYMGREDYSYAKRQKNKIASFKLVSASVYTLMLIISPLLIFLLGTNPPSPKTEISSASTSVYEEEIQAEVLKNDSYWKLAKRYCGDGKYFLSVKEANGSKALFEGDSVKVTCEL